LLLSLVVAGLVPITSRAQEVPADDATTRCAALRSADFSLVQDAPTQIVSAKQVDPDGGKIGYCEIDGNVALKFGFLLRLPSENWNGKFLEIGCGGECGAAAAKALLARCDDPLRRGYACIISDGGHTVGQNFSWANNNPEAPIDLW